jgi:signal peptidase I
MNSRARHRRRAVAYGAGPLLLLLLAAVAVDRLRRRWVLIDVRGPSMEPTHSHGDRVVVRRARPGVVTTGSVVVVRQPGSNGGRPVGARSRWMIKRVAAVAGQAVPPGVPESDALVPRGKLVLLGDNAEQSVDSRLLGYFSTAEVLGHVVRTVGR